MQSWKRPLALAVATAAAAALAVVLFVTQGIVHVVAMIAIVAALIGAVRPAPLRPRGPALQPWHRQVERGRGHAGAATGGTRTRTVTRTNDRADRTGSGGCRRCPGPREAPAHARQLSPISPNASPAPAYRCFRRSPATARECSMAADLPTAAGRRTAQAECATDTSDYPTGLSPYRATRSLRQEERHAAVAGT
jgi:hypothetical protein